MKWALLLFGLLFMAGPLAAQTPGQVKAQGQKLPEAKEDKKPRKSAEYEPVIPPNYRQIMRDIIVVLGDYARKYAPESSRAYAKKIKRTPEPNVKFLVFVRSGLELVVKSERELTMEEMADLDDKFASQRLPIGTLIEPFASSIDGFLEDGLFCGGGDDYNKPSPPGRTKALVAAGDKVRELGKTILNIDHCSNPDFMKAAHSVAQSKHYLWMGNERGSKNLDYIPPSKNRPVGENPKIVNSLADAKNFLAVFDSNKYLDKQSFLPAVRDTNHDLIFIDLFYPGGLDRIAREDVIALKFKKMGAKRKVVAILPVGFAEASRPYWKDDFAVGTPPWLAARDPLKPEHLIVEYWNEEWKAMLGKYMRGIVELGFDGVLFDGLESYFHFESANPLEE
jgi:cysteinyl-tRNA synthetase